MELVKFDRQLYKEINNDKELVEFFCMLTECFNEELKEELKQRNIHLDTTKPDFENLIIMARGLKDLGIETSLLSTDLVTNKTNLFNSSPDEIKKVILGIDSIAFNDYEFTFDDQRKMRWALSFHPAAYIREILSEHETARKTKEELTKNLTREQEKYKIKKRIFGSLVSKKEELIEMEIQQKELNYIYEKNEFFIKSTEEQKKKMLIMFDSICNVREEYSIYLQQSKAKDEVLEEAEDLLFDRALTRLNEMQLDKINYEKIQVKLLKLLYLTRLNRIPITSIEFLCFDLDILSFNVNLVDWFINTHKSELLNLSTAAMENFDLLIENKSSKILSKKLLKG